MLQSLRKVHPGTTRYYKACTKHIPQLLCITKLAQSTSEYYFVLHSLLKKRPSTTLHYKACTKYFPVFLWTTRLTQSTSQYFFVLQSLHKARPSTTLYYKACTKHVPVLLCTTKLAQSTSQYYFVLQSLHKATLYHKTLTGQVPLLLFTTRHAQNTSQYYFVLQILPKASPTTAQSSCQYRFVLQNLHKPLPTTTLYYKACTKYVPVLLCTTKLAQSTSHDHFVLQNSHRARPSTTLYYKTCTKHFPVLLCTTNLAQSTPQDYFVPRLPTARPSTTLYYKPCTKHVPELLCTTKLANVNRTWQKSCSHYTAICNQRFNKRKDLRTTTHCRTQRRNRLPIVTIGPATAAHTHTRAAHHRRLHPLHTEKHKVSCSGFLPNTSPMQHPCNHTRMHFAAPCYKRACIYAHGNKTWQQSCSHYNAISNHSLQNTLELRTRDEPSIAKHHQGTTHAPKQTDRTRHAHEVPFIAGRSHFILKNTRFRAPASSPPFMNVLVCDVKSHTALCECMDMRCNSQRPSWMYCYVM